MVSWIFKYVKTLLDILKCNTYHSSVARPEQVFYGGEVKGESAMTYFDDIGTRVVHTYQVFKSSRLQVLYSLWKIA